MEFPKSKIVLVGTLPPPIGGVSVHLNRFLLRSGEIACDLKILDFKRAIVTSATKTIHGYRNVILAWAAADVVHIHMSNNLKIAIALFSRIFAKKVIYTHHNNVVSNSFLFGLMYKTCNFVIFVNGKCIPAKILAIPVGKRKWDVIPAFIPPLDGESLPNGLSSRIKDYKVVISFNAYRRSFIGDGEVYGIDLVMELFKRLVCSKVIENFCFVFLDPSGTHGEQVTGSLAGLDCGAADFIYIKDDDVSFFSLLRESTLSIRATRTDGDSLSIRESLSLGVPVIASDIVERPDGCVTFNSGDVDDLECKVLQVLISPVVIDTSGQDFFKPVIECYNGIIKGGLL